MFHNGSCNKAFAFWDACKYLGLRPIRTGPFTLRTNGTAERCIKTILTEWPYARAFNSLDQRAAELPIGTHVYNWHRPHAGLNAKTTT